MSASTYLFCSGTYHIISEKGFTEKGWFYVRNVWGERFLQLHVCILCILDLVCKKESHVLLQREKTKFLWFVLLLKYVLFREKRKFLSSYISLFPQRPPFSQQPENVSWELLYVSQKLFFRRLHFYVYHCASKPNIAYSTKCCFFLSVKQCCQLISIWFSRKAKVLKLCRKVLL